MSELRGEFYIGVDLGKVKDYSAIAVIKKDDHIFKLVLIKKFPLGAPYASIIGYVKVLCDKLKHVQKICVDATNQDYIVEDMKNGGMENVEGVRFTVPRKQEMATLLKQRMLNGVFKIPYDPDLINEMHVERFELRKDGTIAFNHLEGTHDDVFWALALAVEASKAGAPSRLVRAF